MRPRLRVVASGLLIGLATRPIGAVALGEPYFETVADADRLPDGVVTALAQDRLGGLWVGSLRGVLRYDGYALRPLRVLDAGDAARGAESVRALTPASDGGVWLALQAAGLARYRPRCDCFERWRHAPEDPKTLASDAVLALAADAAGGLWIGTANAGLDYLAADGREFRHFPPDPAHGPSHATVRALLLDRRGDLWVGTRNGLDRLRAGGDRFERIATEALQGRYVYALYEDSGGRIWLGTQDRGAAWLDPADGSVRWLGIGTAASDSVSHPWISGIVEARPGELWVATFGAGIDVLDLASLRVVRRLRHDPALPGSLAHDQVTAPLRDQSGLIWAGSWGGGLQRHNPNARAFSTLRHSPNRAQGLSRASILSAVELPDGRLWLGTDGNGIDVFDRERGLVDGHRPDPDRPGALRDGVVRSLALTAEGTLWVGTQQAGLHRYDSASRRFRVIANAAGGRDNRIVQLLASRDGGLYVGAERGLARLDLASETITPLKPSFGSEADVSPEALVEDGSGHLWVGTLDGLLLQAAATDGRRPPDVPLRRVLPGRVLSLRLDAAGRLWVLTGSALLRLDGWQDDAPRFAEVIRVATDEEVLGNHLLADAQGRLWTERYVIDPASGERQAFGRAEGVDIGGTALGAAAATRDGLLLIGGTRGLLLIEPSRYQPWSFVPPVRAVAANIDGLPVPLDGIEPSLRLAPGQRRFSIEFSALDFSAPARNRYAFRLQGFDRDWIAAGAEQRLASYGGLWPGQYVLEVRGSNRDGVFNPLPLRVPVTVLPAFWQTPWFLGMAGLGLLAAGVSGYRLRTARIRRRAAELAQMVAQRTAELRAAHDHLLETQQQLVLREKMASLGTLTAGVAHEFNNPANYISGAAQNLEVQLAQFRDFLLQLAGDDAEPEVLAAIEARLVPQREQLATILEGARRIHAIVQDLRQFTRLDEAEHKRIRLGEPIRACVNLLRTRFPQVRFQLDLAFDPELECQPAKLGQVFMNLIVNACEAIERAVRRPSEQAAHRPQTDNGDSEFQGTVSIRTRECGGAVEVDVADDGCGIADTAVEHIFEPFFTTKPVGAGTGMGLAIAFGIVREHGGSLELESTGVAGTCFKLRLPLGR